MVSKKTSDSLLIKTPEQNSDIQPVVQVDEYHGMGGSYVFDPATGKRTRVEPVGADSIRPESGPEHRIDVNTEGKVDEIQ